MTSSELYKITVTDDSSWIPVSNLASGCEVDNSVQVIHCDTRDFYIICSNEKPKIYKNAECNYEHWRNEGLRKLYNLLSKTNRENYAIRPEEIIPWLKELCEKTGGYEKDWRCLKSNVKDCYDWNLKYIRFIRNDKQPDEFIVCNSYLTPIKWREVIPNLAFFVEKIGK